ncbi:hypothetical protein [Thermoflexus sp.]|nr:hypothetical protein [Thermoflexus sp.]MCS6964967.1 hypothetical protein [Thermoflexus sp.]
MEIEPGAWIRAALLASTAGVMLWVDRCWDLPEGRIPRLVAIPLMGMGLGCAIAFRDLSGLILWPAFYLGWKAGGVGGGDAKAWMGISAMAGILGAAAGLLALVVLARARLWWMGYGWVFGLRPPARPPMALPTAGMALGAALICILSP